MTSISTIYKDGFFRVKRVCVDEHIKEMYRLRGADLSPSKSLFKPSSYNPVDLQNCEEFPMSSYVEGSSQEVNPGNGEVANEGKEANIFEHEVVCVDENGVLPKTVSVMSEEVFTCLDCGKIGNGSGSSCCKKKIDGYAETHVNNVVDDVSKKKKMKLTKKRYA